MNRVLLLVSVLCFVGVANSQPAQQPVTTIEFIQTVDAHGIIRCTQVTHDATKDGALLTSAASSALHVLDQTIGRSDSLTGLDIVLRGTAQLESFPAAKQAFINAAARWEAIILTPVKVVLDVDYGPTDFGTPFSSSNVIGSTSAPTRVATTVQGGGGTAVSFRRFADSLKSRNPGNSDLCDSIPNAIPNSLGTNPSPAAVITNLQAIGFYPALMSETVALGQTPNIGFNSAFAFDLDPSDGITSNQIDFDGTAVHEMGHALGFICSIGENGSKMYTWDIFRFRPGVVTDLGVFKTAQRVNTPGPNPTGGDQVFWDGVREWEVSTATGDQTGGDGNQASHWRSNESRTAFPVQERTIGVMDPTAAFGEREIILLADIKAMSMMGWQMDFVQYSNIISPVTAVALRSDYTTPTSVRLQWKNPTQFYNNAPLANWKLIVTRDGTLSKEYASPTPGAVVVLQDSGLVQYENYTYKLMAVHTASGDTGMAVTRSIIAGGSPKPSSASGVSIAANGTTAILKFTAPTQHDDKTPLHNLLKAKIYRGSDFSKPIDSLLLATTDTSKVFIYTDTPPSKFSPLYAYYVSFIGSAAAPQEGPAVAFPTVRAGAFLTSAYGADFEENRQSVVADGLWDSTNVVAHRGTYSLGALSYPNNASFSVYIPQVKGNGSPFLSFWTICRTEAGQDFGLVEVSRNRGRSWNTVLTLDESAHPEWQAATNVWFQMNISLGDYATDTILVRFRLISNASVTKFGWLIDDIVLSPITTGVQEEHGGIPTRYSLEQNYPNPFNPSTQITYALKDRGQVTLKVYDMLGREVREVVNSIQDAGWYSVRFDVSNSASGVYYYTLKTGSFVETKKMLLMK
jgi:hypothetical protein